MPALAYCDAADVSFGYDDQPIVSHFSTVIMRGDKIGVIGRNGAGKTTLLRILLGQLAPQHGSVRLGTNLSVAYFDQLRGQLDETQTVQENVSPNSDMLDVGGKRRHVIGYLKDFLFSPQRSRTPVWVLSGGEKNRLLLAKLFARSANVLVMDEPTNDLDVETLELLEELLLNYNGTVLLVSHDRTFINNVVTSTLVLDGSGQIDAYAGGYDRTRAVPTRACPSKHPNPFPADSIRSQSACVWFQPDSVDRALAHPVCERSRRWRPNDLRPIILPQRIQGWPRPSDHSSGVPADRDSGSRETDPD